MTWMYDLGPDQEDAESTKVHLARLFEQYNSEIGVDVASPAEITTFLRSDVGMQATLQNIRTKLRSGTFEEVQLRIQWPRSHQSADSPARDIANPKSGERCPADDYDHVKQAFKTERKGRIRGDALTGYDRKQAIVKRKAREQKVSTIASGSGLDFRTSNGTTKTSKSGSFVTVAVIDLAGDSTIKDVEERLSTMSLTKSKVGKARHVQPRTQTVSNDWKTLLKEQGLASFSEQELRAVTRCFGPPTMLLRR